MKISEFLIESYYDKYEFTTPIMLSSSDSETISVSNLLSLEAGAKERFMDLNLGYTKSQGEDFLRIEISKLYEKITPEKIIVFSGAEEGIFSFMSAILKPSDELIVQFPCYQSSYEIARSNGVKIRLWEFKEEQQWKPNFEELEKLATTKTKALVINTPNNPTGYNFSQNEFEKIVAFCRDRDIYLFSDEVYRLSEYDSQNTLKCASDLYEKGVSLGVLSKPYGLPGLRIGWIATQDQVIIDQLKSFKYYVTICNSSPSEFLAAIAIKNTKKIIERNKEIIRGNLRLLDKFFTKYSKYFTWVRPNAGCIGFVKILLPVNAEKFSKGMREAKGALLLPSTTYNFGNRHFRIGFGRANFKIALDLLEDYVKEMILANKI